MTSTYFLIFLTLTATAFYGLTNDKTEAPSEE